MSMRKSLVRENEAKLVLIGICRTRKLCGWSVYVGVSLAEVGHGLGVCLI